MSAGEKRKVVFLDRDGVINRKAEEHQYIVSVRDFSFTDGLFEMCAQLAGQGFVFVVVTNQRGVAKGLYKRDAVEEMHAHMLAAFEEHAIPVIAVYYCPHEENACDCRKPKPGMLVRATEEFDIDLPGSVMISDSEDDIHMARDFGVGRQILIRPDRPSDAVTVLFG